MKNRGAALAVALMIPLLGAPTLGASEGGTEEHSGEAPTEEALEDARAAIEATVGDYIEGW